MGLLNPVYGIILSFLFVFTIPIAIFAILTTFLAFSILVFRVIVVYIELAFGVIPHYLLGVRSTPKPFQRTKSFTNPAVSPVRRRKRRSSTSSNISAGSITPVPGDSGLGLSQSIGPTRDFEGVGGWRLDNPSDDDALWTNINSRLELPADHVRRHHRSLTSGSIPVDGKQNTSYGSETVMNSSKVRTPPNYGTVLVVDGYFPQVPVSPRTLKRSSSGLTGTSGSSGSSKGSSGLSMKQR